MKPHKHAQFIKAWADGATIEFRWPDTEWKAISHPRWEDDCEYRVWEEPKPDIVEEMSVYRNLHRRFDFERPYDEPVITQWLCNMRVTRDGNTHEIKSAEIIK
jgi:hypothetical protein